LTGKPSKVITGFLEVYVNGRLVHSKKNKQGYIDTKGKLDKVCKVIEEEMQKIKQ